MTLEQSGRAALRAASAGNLDELRDALVCRAAAITHATNAAPSLEMHARLVCAVEIGETIRGEIRTLKLGIAAESARLTQIQTYSR